MSAQKIIPSLNTIRIPKPLIVIPTTIILLTIAVLAIAQTHTVYGLVIVFLTFAGLDILARKATNSQTSSSTQTGISTGLSTKTQDFDQIKAIYESLLTGIGEGIIIMDWDGRIILVNKWAQLILGTSAKDIIGKRLADIVLIEKEKGFFVSINKLLARLSSSGQKIQATLHIFEEHQTKFSAPATLATIFSKGKAIGTLVVLPDTSQEKEIERMRTEFLSVVAHQLRSPLGSMRWGMEMLLSGDVGTISQQVREALKQIYESNRWMITLVNDLLNVSRIEQGKITNEPELIDYLKIIKTVINELELDATKKSIEIALENKNDQTPMTWLDGRRFREVIQNLLSNAIKYSFPNQKVTVAVDQTDKYVQISVADQGIGIPKNDQGKIFSKFFRAQNAQVNKSEGTGLGLFVIKSYVESWKGKIWFESQENQGTTFFVEIPLAS